MSDVQNSMSADADNYDYRFPQTSQFVARGTVKSPLPKVSPPPPAALSQEGYSEAEKIIIETCCDLAVTLITKNRDYGKGNIQEFGQLGILIRLSDKYNRLKNLLTNNQKEHYEPVTDSWRDLAGYAIIGYLNAEGKW